MNAGTDWKAQIIRLTEGESARAGKIDASFFPPVSESRLCTWEREHSLGIPEAIRDFLGASDGLEAQKGCLWPVLPLARWTVAGDPDDPSDWRVRFGESETHDYFFSPGRESPVHRQEHDGRDPKPFAACFQDYLAEVFRGAS